MRGVVSGRDLWATLRGRLAAVVALVGFVWPWSFASIAGPISYGDQAHIRFDSPWLLHNATLDQPGDLHRGDWTDTLGEPSLLFQGDSAWLHAVYATAFALSVAGLLLPGGSRRGMIVGLAGVTASAVFLFGLSIWARATYRTPYPLTLEWGSFAAIGGFLGLLLDGLWAPRRARGMPIQEVFE